MGSVNKVILVGNIGRDRRVRDEQQPERASRGSVSPRPAAARTPAPASGKTGRSGTAIVLFGRQATSLKPYLKKGSLIAVDGRLQTRSWQDKDGQKRYMTEVVADRIELIGGRSGGSGGGSGGSSSGGGGRRDEEFGYDEGAPAEQPRSGGSVDDDIPF